MVALVHVIKEVLANREFVLVMMVIQVVLVLKFYEMVLGFNDSYKYKH